MEWRQLITNKRLGQEYSHPKRYDDRTEFKRDYDRLIFSAPFRRLQNKTQVFPLPGSVFVHNRLTHSLEVASVGMSLGNDVSRALIKDKYPDLEGTLFEELGQIVSTACLAHDMGNPPFGHSGEKAIQTFFTEGKGLFLREMVSPDLWCDITHFEGNANTFRLLTHRYKGRRQGGFVMTYPTLAAIAKYPWSSRYAGEKGKFGFFHSERDEFTRIADEVGLIRRGTDLVFSRHPLVYLVEAADDICYEIMDIEDSHKLKILSYDETVELLVNFFNKDDQEKIWKRIKYEELSDQNEVVAYIRARVIGLLIQECVSTFIINEERILQGEFSGSLIDNIAYTAKNNYKKCAEVSSEKIYRSKPVLDIELAGYKIMETLMEHMTEAATHPDRFYSKQLIHRVSSQYDIDSQDLDTRIMAVIDYISGMTDVYALDVYQKISGLSLPIV